LKESKKKIKFVSSLGEEERRLIDLTFSLAGQNITTEASAANRSNLKYSIIIGRRDLDLFLLDPLKKVN